MKRGAAVLVLAAVAVASNAVTRAAFAKDAREQAVDAPFAQFDQEGSPGAAVGIYQGGRTVYTNRYGFADLEHRVPIEPETVFLVGSVAKQFTAYAVALLARDRKLDLDADIRTYLRHVPDLGHRITVRHLLHHTSGLREQVALFRQAGLDNALQEQWMVDALLARQRALNFVPGRGRFAYTNTNYVLLGQIVAAVSGQSLRQFTTERLFAPLGMANTFFHDDVGEIVPNLARAYVREGGERAWHRQVVPYDGHVGATNLYSTLDDMLRWIRNFVRPGPDDRALIAQVSAPGTLDDGTPISYGFGLRRGPFAGHSAVYHLGSDSGFHAVSAYFPDADFAVVILANTPIDRESTLASIVDTYLNEGSGKVAPSLPAAVTPAAGLTAALAGDYIYGLDRAVALEASDSGMIWRVRGSAPKPLVFRADGTFDAGDRERSEGRYYEPVRNEAGQITAFVEAGDDRNGVTERYERFTRLRAPATSLGPLVGEYRSAEIDTTYALTVEHGKLVARTLWAREPIVLEPVLADRFEGSAPSVWSLIVRRNGKGEPTALLVTSAGVEALLFERIWIAR